MTNNYCYFIEQMSKFVQFTVLEQTHSDSEKVQTNCVFLTEGAVSFNLSDDEKQNIQKDSMETYELKVNGNQTIEIKGQSNIGVFYGIQTLLSLCAGRSSGPCAGMSSVPCVAISDSPRYPYRGMHIDVSRNFHKKEEILKLLDVMTMYKMNKLHFHLTDDEGWRLEIPGLPELTNVSHFFFLVVKNV